MILDLYENDSKTLRVYKETYRKTRQNNLYFIIRSNFNSRGVNSRELRRVFGHSSESSQ